MKQVFLSASWSRQIEARVLAEDLEQDNVHVKATWLYEKDDRHGERHLREMGYTDIREVAECDVYVRLSDDLSTPTVPSHLATGARFFEMGLAWALGKVIYVVGGHQNIFDHMPRVNHVKDKEELKRELCPHYQIQ